MSGRATSIRRSPGCASGPFREAVAGMAEGGVERLAVRGRPTRRAGRGPARCSAEERPHGRDNLRGDEGGQRSIGRHLFGYEQPPAEGTRPCGRPRPRRVRSFISS